MIPRFKRNGPRPVLSGWVAMALILFSSVGSQAAEPAIRIGDFSSLQPGGDLPAVWKPLTFKKIETHTRYRLAEDNGRTVLRAESRNAASGLIRKVSIDPRKFPYITWQWKVDGVYGQGDVSRKDGDDYPARIYITFAYDPGQVGFFEKAKYKTAKLIYGETPPLGAINYIWASRAPIGLVVANAYTERVKMIVLQSGAGGSGQWRTEKRNLYEDYLKAFGREPTLISGIAVMTDSDNTGESAGAWYGDIVFSAR